MNVPLRTARLKDVADKAGCSPATVSRVLNDNPFVDVDIRERVLKAATELHYVPNGPARALRSTSTRLVGAIIPTLSHAIYATMIDGLQSRLSENRVSLIINTSLYDIAVEREQVRVLVERGVESIVLVGHRHLPETIDMLERYNIGYVFTYTTNAPPKGAAVGFDNVKAGITAAKFLHDLGHRRCGMIAGVTLDNDRAQGRVDGFRRGLANFGVDVSGLPVIEAPYKIDSGYAAMKMLMENNPTLTAIFCGSDILAAGATKFCSHSGIKVPDDVSILGFDNLEVVELTTPELSTLEVPALEMGRLAADYILAHPVQRKHIRQRDLPVRLIIRGSTGPVARASPSGIQRRRSPSPIEENKILE
jgi:LacI family transcriptional regulator